MTQLRMSDDGDILINNNKFELTENRSDEEIVQRLLQRLRFFFGEWFMDNTLGVPWFQIVFEKSASPKIVEGVLKDAIISEPDVVSLNRFDPIIFDPATREANVVFDVTTINGNTLTINEVLP